MTKKTYQIKVVLRGSRPEIWRRILVASDVLLPDFHKILQTTMGWTNSHLHQFMVNDTFYRPKMSDDEFWEELNNVDYSKLKISDMLKSADDEIIYEYDFGDGWEHNIILEKIDTNEGSKSLAICLAGENNCPPEDCGGIGGYMYLLEILKDKNHEEYDNYMVWLGGEYDSKYFSKIEINEMLQSK